MQDLAHYLIVMEATTYAFLKLETSWSSHASKIVVSFQFQSQIVLVKQRAGLISNFICLNLLTIPSVYVVDCCRQPKCSPKAPITHTNLLFVCENYQLMAHYENSPLLCFGAEHFNPPVTSDNVTALRVGSFMLVVNNPSHYPTQIEREICIVFVAFKDIPKCACVCVCALKALEGGVTIGEGFTGVKC